MNPKQPLPPFDEVEDGLQDVCFDLLTDSPFYGNIISSINRELVRKEDKENQVECTQMEPLTLASVKLDVIYEMWATLTDPQKRERFKHEVLHFVFLHPWKDKPENVGLFYTACDISANMYCNDTLSFRKDYFSKLESKYNCSLDTKEGYLSIYDSLVNLYRKVPMSIKKKHGSNVQAYEDEIMKWQDKALRGEFFEKGTSNLTEAIVFLPQNTKGDTNASGMSSMIQGMKRGGASEDDIKNAIQNFLAQGSDPWQSVRDGTSESAAEDVVKRLLSDAKGRGDLPGGLESYVDILLTPPKIDWRQELRNFTKTSGHVRMGSTMTRRSKRYKTFPSGKIKRLQRVAVAIDTSGSMSDDEFNQAISEVAGALSSNCEVIVIQADCQVDHVEVYSRKLPPLDRVTRMGNGGTSFNDALLYVKTGGKLDKHSKFEQFGKVDGMVYITDGYAPAPELENYPRCKTLWLTTQKSVETMENEGFKGRILFVDCSDM